MRDKRERDETETKQRREAKQRKSRDRTRKEQGNAALYWLGCKNPERITIIAKMMIATIPIKIKMLLKKLLKKLLVTEPCLVLPPQFGQLLAFEEICLPQVTQ
jgi:hypothetical protein